MGATIFVGNLHQRTTESELARFFAAAGRIAAVRIPADRATGRSRGFGFVEFRDRESAEKAFSLGEGSELDGNRLRLSWAREQSASGGSRRAKGRPAGDGPFAEQTAEGWPPETIRPGSSPVDDYTERRREKHRRHGKHGSDRKHRHGLRRVIE